MFGVQAYQQVATMTSDAWSLVDQLYAGAIKRIDEGKIDKALRIVEEGLFGSLNPAGKLSRGLADAYEVVLLHLKKGDAEGLSTARTMLTTMHDGWKGIRGK